MTPRAAQSRRTKNAAQMAIRQSMAREQTMRVREFVALNNENTLVACAPNDVICGRGKSSLQHPGNKVYQSIVNQYAEIYQSNDLSVDEKRRMQSEIIGQIESCGGRFLKPERQGWTILPFEVKRQKVAHALQYRVRELRKQDLKPATKVNQNCFKTTLATSSITQNPFDASWDLEREFVPVSEVFSAPSETHYFGHTGGGYPVVNGGYHAFSCSESDADSLEQDFLHKAFE